MRATPSNAAPCLSKSVFFSEVFNVLRGYLRGRLNRSAKRFSSYATIVFLLFLDDYVHLTMSLLSCFFLFIFKMTNSHSKNNTNYLNEIKLSYASMQFINLWTNCVMNIGFIVFCFFHHYSPAVKMFQTDYVFTTDNTSSDADVFHFLPTQISLSSPPHLSIYSPFVFPLCLKPSDLGPSFSQSPVFLSHLSLISRLLLPICFSLPFFMSPSLFSLLF